MPECLPACRLPACLLVCLPPACPTSLLESVAAALEPKASDSKTNTGSMPYISFTVPAICYAGDWFGYNIIPSGCLAGGKTYEGSTGSTTTVSNIFDLTIAITATQTSCSQPTATSLVSNDAIEITATWPSIQLESTVDWYPLAGGETGVGLTITVSNLKMVMQGAFMPRSARRQCSAQTLPASGMWRGGPGAGQPVVCASSTAAAALLASWSPRSPRSPRCP